MLQKMPDSALHDLPTDVIACEWGYEDTHPFAARCERLADIGIPFMVCPGTSSWNSFTGRTANCIENIKQAVSAGVNSDALGMMLTDWGDNGHLQPHSASYVGIVAGGLAWNQNPECLEKAAAPAAATTEDWYVPPLKPTAPAAHGCTVPCRGFSQGDNGVLVVATAGHRRVTLRACRALFTPAPTRGCPAPL